MVEFYSTNPATTARYKEDEQSRMKAGELRMQEQAFRQRYGHEQGVAVDAAIRRGLGGGLGGTIAEGSGGGQAQPRPQASPAPDANGIAWQPPPQGQPQAQPQGQPQPQAQPQGGNLMRELTATPGGGALALEQHQAQRQREDALEDKAWEFYVNGDIQAASTMLMQATGQDMPAFWKTKEAMLRARAANVEAQRLYPTDMETRRKFIEAYMADPGNALNTFLGEGPQAVRVGTPQSTTTGIAGITYTPGQGYSGQLIKDESGETLQPAAGAGGQRSYEWNMKYNAYLALYKDDEAGALQFASGSKYISDTELRQMSFVLAPKYLLEPGLGMEDADYEKKLMAKADELYLAMRPAPTPMPAPGGGGIDVGGSRVNESGLSGARDQLGYPRDTGIPKGPPGGIVQPSAPQPGAPGPPQQPAAPQFPETAGPPSQPSLGAPEGPQDFAAEGADVKAWRQRRGGAPDVMRGIGTREDPLVPQSQADIETAPSGTFILIDGATWEKP